MTATLLAVLGLGVIGGLSAPTAAACDSVNAGYQCQPEISHNWGQYSPFYSVPSNISADIPAQCEITFVQILSRHGARDPTASKTTSYNNTITRLQASAIHFEGKYAFLKDFAYTLGADQLTLFGQQEMINSGTKFYNRYSALTREETPFVRSSSEARVVESAQNFTQGYHAVKSKSKSDSSYPYPIVVISEDAGQNNTLNHDLCTTFEDGPDSKIAASAQAKWTAVFVPPIQSRINGDLGTNLSSTDIISLMDLCPFTTVASPTGAVGPFCALFTESEFESYAHYESLNKYYGYGAGNPLGPTQGVGFTNELIARLTDKPVVDHTSTNSTLDGNSKTFPLGKKLYADFSHDNDMTAIMFAMGLFDGLEPLSNTTLGMQGQDNARYTAASTVPFAARVYVEKMKCKGGKGKRDHGEGSGKGGGDDEGKDDKELVRVVVNDRVMPLQNCGADALGRCTVEKYVQSLSFARSGGDWASCGITA